MTTETKATHPDGGEMAITAEREMPTSVIVKELEFTFEGKFKSPWARQAAIVQDGINDIRSALNWLANSVERREHRVLLMGVFETLKIVEGSAAAVNGRRAELERAEDERLGLGETEFSSETKEEPPSEDDSDSLPSLAEVLALLPPFQKRVFNYLRRRRDGWTTKQMIWEHFRGKKAASITKALSGLGPFLEVDVSKGYRVTEKYRVPA